MTEPDQMPAGRYGHAVCMHRNRFFVFGGQVDMVFFDDLWCFDLNSSAFTCRSPCDRSRTTLADP